MTRRNWTILGWHIIWRTGRPSGNEWGAYLWGDRMYGYTFDIALGDRLLTIVRVRD